MAETTSDDSACPPPTQDHRPEPRTPPYDDLIEAIPDAVVIVERSGRIQRVNRQAEALFGWPRSELCGQLVELLVPERLRAMHTAARHDYARSPRFRNMGAPLSLVALRRDGTELPTEISLAPSSDGTAVVAVVRDVTQRKEAEGALRRAGQALEQQIALRRQDEHAERTQAEQLRIARVTADVGLALTEGGDLPEVLARCAQALVEHLGVAFARVWTLDPATATLELRASAGLYTHLDGPHARVPVGAAKIGRIAATRQPHLTNDVQNDPLITDPDWARREGMVGFVGYPLLVDGGVVGVLAAFSREPLGESALVATSAAARAISVGVRRSLAEAESAALSAQLLHAQKMDAIGQLAGGVAHDFNNLLSVILGYSMALLRDLAPDSTQRADLQEIVDAGRRAAALTRQLLLFSRKQAAEPVPFDLNGRIAGMQRMLQRLLGERHELRFVPRAATSVIEADPSHIDQVVLNLVVNARDAMPGGGRIEIETANVMLDDDPALDALGGHSGAHVMLTVSDTGVGLDEATQARIFEPFFTTKPDGAGTGLGLSTVFGIVRQAQGTIRVHSAQGRGTTFVICLPRAEAPTGLVGLDAGIPALGGSETILLVEDEEAVRRAARTILTRHGYHVLTAADGAEALRLGAEHDGPVHLLLSDVVMPRMSGPELARRFVALRPTARVLCMSGYADELTDREGLLGAGVAFLPKPFTPDALLRKVRTSLEAGGAPGAPEAVTIQ